MKNIGQKITGLFLIIISITLVATGFLYDPITKETDCTICFIFIPLGLYMLFSKNKIMI